MIGRFFCAQERRTHMGTPQLEAALQYARLGWRVIPIAPRSKDHPLVKWQEFQHRAPTTAELTAWFTQWPDANLAVLTGAGSGLVVVDIDSPEGEKALAGLGHITTLTSTTGRGRHLFFKHPGGTVSSTQDAGFDV